MSQYRLSFAVPNLALPLLLPTPWTLSLRSKLVTCEEVCKTPLITFDSPVWPMLDEVSTTRMMSNQSLSKLHAHLRSQDANELELPLNVTVKGRSVVDVGVVVRRVVVTLRTVVLVVLTDIVDEDEVGRSFSSGQKVTMKPVDVHTCSVEHACV